MANNKVVYAGRVLIDLTEDTVERDKLAEGITAHNKKGETIIGTATLLNAQPQVTVTPSDTEQIIEPESPYNALSSVKVEASQGGGGSGDIELPDFADDIAYLITGNCSARFQGDTELLSQYGERIATTGITSARNMFAQTDVSVLPFVINCAVGAVDLYRMFYQATNLYYAPQIFVSNPSNMLGMFQGCHNLTELVGEFYKSAWTPTNNSQIFRDCYSLRKVNGGFLYVFPISQTGSYFNRGFQNCFSLGELTNLGIPDFGTALTTNRFTYTFDKCSRLKRLTFVDTTCDWTNQTINLSNVGYITQSDYDTYSYYLVHNIIEDETTYQESLLNDNEDVTYIAIGAEYSRYNHESAVETINSLPYTNGGNTIVFNETSGANTIEGAIGNLTEEEIAVALDKGWTVSLI